jgi:hypothetical protein
MPRASSQTTHLPGDRLLTLAKVAGYVCAVVAFCAGALTAAAASESHAHEPPEGITQQSLAANASALVLLGGISVALVVAVAIYIATRNARWYAGASAGALLVVAALLAALAAVLLADPGLVIGAQGSVVVSENGGLSDVAAAALGLLLAAALGGLAAGLTLAASARRHA